MASASSSVARLFIRDAKSAANLLIRARAATDRVKNPVPAIRSLLLFNTTPAYQYPIFFESFPVMQSGFHVSSTQEATIWKMKAGQGKRVVDNESGDSEEDIDFDEEELDDLDISDDEEFDDIDEDDDEEEEEEEEEEKYTKKNKK